MAEQRRHRLELPGIPSTDDPVKLKKYLTDLRRLTMDEFNRMSTDLFNFKEKVINEAGFTLQAVSQVSVTATEYSATFTWTLPQQTEITPTHVRVRIAEFGDAWAEYPYPLTTWTVNALLPGTEYTFQIQLVYQGEVAQSYISAVRNCPSVPTLVESTSEIRSRTFTTVSGVGPPGDGGGADTDFPIPDVDGTPGTGGSGTDCHWAWKTQIASETDGTWSDTGDTGTADGDAGSITLDTTATGLNYDSSRLYRLCIDQVCDGVAENDYQCGEPWTGDNDWGDACGGSLTNSSLGDAPYDTADLFAIPTVCLLDTEGLQITDGVSDLQIIEGSAFNFLYRSNSDWYMRADDLTSESHYWGQTGWALLPLVSALDNTDDFSIALTYKIDTLYPSGGVAINDPLLSLSSRVILSLISDGTNYGFQITAQRETGGSLILQSPINLTVDSEFHEVVFSSDANGNKFLVVDGTKVAEDTTGNEIRLDGNDGTVRIYGTTESHIGKMYGWSRALAESEVVLNPPGPLSYAIRTGTTTVPFTSMDSGDDVESGDIILIYWTGTLFSNTIPSTPSGWTLVDSDRNGSNNPVALFAKVADGTETTVTLTGGGTASAFNLMSVIIKGGAGWESGGVTAAGSTSTSVAGESLTSTGADHMMIQLFNGNTANVPTLTGASWTTTVLSGGVNEAAGIAYYIGSGSSPSFSWNISPALYMSRGGIVITT